MESKRPKLVISPGDTPLITHLIEEKPNLENHVKILEKKTASEKDDFKDEYQILFNKGLERLKNLDLSKKYELEKSSAEIKSPTKLKIGENTDDIICFLSTDTILGELCADILSKFYKK